MNLNKTNPFSDGVNRASNLEVLPFFSRQMGLTGFRIAFHFLNILLFAFPAFAPSQTTVEGYVFEENNRGYLNQVQIQFYRLPENEIAVQVESNREGYFATVLPAGKYRIVALKDIFFEKEEVISIGDKKAFVSFELKRRPGYLFDVTLAEVRDSPDRPVDAISGATVEIYNRTRHKLEMIIEKDDDAFFQFTFERGNHYTLMIRKEGYLAKRIEVYVNINGCIICVDGVRDVSPGVTDNLSSGNEMGTLLANIELDRAKIDKRIQIQNIYYDFDKWDIRPDAAKRLDNVVILMRDNPGLSVELGSHTDSRGNDQYNETLSQKRAIAAVEYIISEGIDSARITAKGYGEKVLKNRCKNGVECSEEEHQQNRRTELRITGIVKGFEWKSLEQIISEESPAEFSKEVTEVTKPRDRQLPEANNSVKLGSLQPAEEHEIEETPEQEEKPILREFKDVRILDLPKSFKGCAVELTRSTKGELGADNLAFVGQKNVFHRVESDTVHAYFIANLGPCDKAESYFKKNKELNYEKINFGSNGSSFL